MKKKTTILPFLTIVTAVLAILSISVFTFANQKNISNNNREYLLDNTNQMAVLVDDSLMHGLMNIQVLSNLAGELITSPEIDVPTLQHILDNSIFDFIEFVDRDGKNHNTTGGISEANDRQCYLDSMQGNSGIELILNSRATNETLLVPLTENKIGACIMGLENRDWYIIQIFPNQANKMMISKANRINILLALFLVTILELPESGLG